MGVERGDRDKEGREFEILCRLPADQQRNLQGLVPLTAHRQLLERHDRINVVFNT